MTNDSSVLERPSVDKQQLRFWKNLVWKTMADDTLHEIKNLMVTFTNNLCANQIANPAGAENPRKITFASCRARFAGQYDREAVEEFINAVETFKTLEDIDDNDALKGVSLLLTGIASAWWQGVRREAETWLDCLRLLREHFSPIKAPYQIYMEIFNDKQDSQMGINRFILEKRALLAQLPQGRHDEECQIDLIYGLIHIKYRQFLTRSEIRTFNDLIQQARVVEQNHLEAISEDKALLKPKRCSYCNYRGHTTDECRRRQQKQQQNAPAGEKEGKP